MAPKETQALIPGNCECYLISGKRVFADVIQDIEMGRLSWVVQVALKHNHKFTQNLEGSSTQKEEGDLPTSRREEAQGSRVREDTGFKDGGRDHKPRNARNAAVEAGKGKKRSSPWSFQRECGTANTLVLASEVILNF